MKGFYRFIFKALFLTTLISIVCSGNLYRTAAIPEVTGPIKITVESYPFNAADHSLVPQDQGKYKYIEEEYFTVGRPHAAIDPTPRIERMEQEFDDKEVAVIVLDFELGYGSHLSPAEALAPSVIKARENNVYVVVHVCGTELDPQNVVKQETTLADAPAPSLPKQTRLQPG